MFVCGRDTIAANDISALVLLHDAARFNMLRVKMWSLGGRRLRDTKHCRKCVFHCGQRNDAAGSGVADGFQLYFLLLLDHDHIF